MARIDRSSIDRSAYHALRANAEASKNERNDCTVVAVAAACEVPYDVAHAAMAAEGRKPRRGALWCRTHSAIRALGFELAQCHAIEFISKYPKAHQVLRSVTTHHPDRFKQVWADGNTYLVHVTGHVLTVKNGVNMDWSRGRALRAIAIYRVTKKV